MCDDDTASLDGRVAIPFERRAHRLVQLAAPGQLLLRLPEPTQALTALAQFAPRSLCTNMLLVRSA